MGVLSAETILEKGTNIRGKTGNFMRKSLQLTIKNEPQNNKFSEFAS